MAKDIINMFYKYLLVLSGKLTVTRIGKMAYVSKFMNFHGSATLAYIQNKHGIKRLVLGFWVERFSDVILFGSIIRCPRCSLKERSTEFQLPFD